MTDLVALAAELTNDPLARGYLGMTDAQAAADLNTAYRNKPVQFSDVLEYLVTTRAHTNQGQDTAANNTTPSVILGRLIAVAELVVPDEASLPLDPFGAGTTKTVANTRQLHSAKAFLEMLRSGHLSASVFVNGGTQGDILNDLIGCGIMNTANRTALLDLSTGLWTRAEELGFGEVLPGNVAMARA